MRCLCAAVWIAVMAAGPARGTTYSCWPPASLCERLEPGSIVFIGKQVTFDAGRMVQSFAVEEMLWGPAVRNVRVLLDDVAAGRRGESRFLVAQGREPYRVTACIGLNLPVSDPFVAEFRRSLAERRAATVRVRAAWHHVPLPGTEFALTGNDRRAGGTTRGDAGTLTDSLPPGEYKVEAVRANFSLADDGMRIAVLPASCATATIPMVSASVVSGRFVDFAGAPLRNATLHLAGEGVALSESMFSLTGLIDSFLGLMGRPVRRFPVTSQTRTGVDGRFVFRDVYPGWYYLSTDPREKNENFQVPLPKTYYPQSATYLDAKHIVVGEGRSVEEIEFRLADYGRKRRVIVRVLDRNFQPVAGATVQDGGLDARYPKVVHSGERLTTDSAGQVSLQLWPLNAYRLCASVWGGASMPVRSGCSEVHAGASDITTTIVLMKR